MTLSLQQIAKALNGEIRGVEVAAPGPGHSPQDRSMCVKLGGREGFLVHSFANDDPIACRDYVRQKLGIPAFKPSAKRFSDEDIVRAATMAAAASAPQAPKATLVATYPYPDRDGTLLYQVLRYEPIGTVKAKRERLLARMSKIAEEHKSFSFDVLAGNGVDKATKSKLSKLNDEAGSIADELEAIDAALFEGERRRQSAREAEALRLARYQAQKLAEEVEIFEQCGIDLDKALSTLVTASAKMKASLGKLHALGQVTPSDQQFDSLGRNALNNALVNSIWRRHFPSTILAPDRHSFADLTRRWSSGIRAQIEKRLAA